MTIQKAEKRKHQKWELLDSTLRHYTETAKELGADPDCPCVPNAGSAQMHKRKNANRRMRAFFNMLWNIIVTNGEKSGYLLLLVDADGCQIMTRGDERLRKEAAAAGVCDGAVWSLDAAGPTAISIGLLETRSVTSEGLQHYLHILEPLLICFAPLHINRSSCREKLGGVALLTRAGEDRVHCQMTLGLIAAGLITHYESSMQVSRGYQAQTTGMAWLDINIRSDEIALVHHNDAFFDVLDLPRRQEDPYFMPLKAYIDPLPYNGQFWSILTQSKEVREKDVQLVIGGRRRNVIITTTVDNDEVLNTKSIILQIDTRTRMARAISEKTTNNAIITFDTIIGSCPAMQSAIRKAGILARTESNVLLYGESGVGKDVFAQAIHNASDRRDKPFVAVNCGALPRELIESELFGYEGGAFTGAKKQGNIGKFELANGGTLFLDEVGELPLDLQATLLRAVEQKSFMRVGSNRLIDVDVKIISATNANIPQMIQEKKFRMDLYYRLGTMYLQIPPLRARGSDAVELAEYFIASICRRIRREAPKMISDEAKELLCHLPWPGNVRELQNLMECLVQLYPDEVITKQQVIESLSPLGAGAVGNITAFSAGGGSNFPAQPAAVPVINPYTYANPAMPEWQSANVQPAEAPAWQNESSQPGQMPEWQSMPAQPAETPAWQNESSQPVQMPEWPSAPAQPEQNPGQQRDAGQEKENTPGNARDTGRDEHGLLTEEEIRRAIEKCGGNRSKAARYLGIARKTLYRNMERLGMQ